MGIPDEIVPWLRQRITESEQRLPYYPSAGIRRERQAECDGKRLIVGWCAEVLGDRDLTGYGTPGALKDDPDVLTVTLAVETLRALALPFAGQSGYRREWGPGNTVFDADITAGQSSESSRSPATGIDAPKGQP